jgi:nitroimidazol reductase NimA-like FMN-containing flavoprotein (pyridoxamine 5'-phosphate oxidase superfamily)
LASVLGVACVAILAPLAALAQQIPAATREALGKAKLIYVATRRKSGERSTIAPVWFVYENDAIYSTTSPDSWKAKRIARGSPLYIWVGSESGPFVLGKAEKITDPAVIAHMGDMYSDKYWIAMLGFFRPRPDRVAAGKTVAYKVTLSEGTAPAPAKE